MKIVLLFGPTAVGKTELISNLFRTNYEIINADSMQVYRSLDVGTAKPARDLLDRIPHHLIDIRSPLEQFHTGDFVRLADELASEITARGNIPVICGGTAFYFKNYLFGLPEIPEIKKEVRDQVRIDLKVMGIASLYRELESVDPERAGKVHPNDKYRILRALEVTRGSGQPQSGFKSNKSIRPGIDPLILGLDRERTELYRRIDQRVDEMFEVGANGRSPLLVDEIQGCFKIGLKETDPGMKGIGYREFFLMKQTGEFNLADIRNMIKKNSRHYAKRQMTFFRALPDVKWFHPEDMNLIREEITGFLDVP
ncbi:MAG: tRNA (adenosine(37)-N6)-dimethylallyltransferase MiaA [Spirochaetales bacterium]|nr:tRNA (adenosine(37)-N6)-dimethylallyltransferase MiaA [Spirochaetales bacterium]